MQNNEANINSWFEQFEHKFDKAVPDIVAETATEFFKERFRPENQDWDGVKWAPLSPKYKKVKTPNKDRVLTKYSILRNTIRPSTVTKNRVVISAGNSKVPYARVHNEGLRISGTFNVRSYTNRNFMGKGKPIRIRTHTRSVNYKMPKRQFMGHSRYLNTRLINRLNNYFNS